GNDHYWHAGILGTQTHQAGKAAHAGHGEIEKDEIDIVVAIEKFGDLVEIAGLGNVDAVGKALDRLAQGPAEERMIVSNDQTVVQCVKVCRPLYAHFCTTPALTLHEFR